MTVRRAMIALLVLLALPVVAAAAPTGKVVIAQGVDPSSLDMMHQQEIGAAGRSRANGPCREVDRRRDVSDGSVVAHLQAVYRSRIVGDFRRAKFLIEEVDDRRERRHQRAVGDFGAVKRPANISD